VTTAKDIPPPTTYAPSIWQPTLIDAETAKAMRWLCWTICYLLWLGAAIAVLFLVMLFVAVVNGSLPG
jgi:hypothetical protein